MAILCQLAPPVMHIGFCKEHYSEPLRRKFWVAKAAIGAPASPETELEILKADEVPSVLRKLEGHPLEVIAIVDLATGLRRGELLALAWNNIELDDARLRVERSLEETRAGLRFKSPKTKYGRRSISLPQGGVVALREPRRKQLELRMALGLGRPEPGALVSAIPTGRQCRPTNLAGTGGERARR